MFMYLFVSSIVRNLHS